MKKTFAVLAGAGLLLATGLFSAPPAQAASCVKVASVIGKNYQRAQDIWRAQGFVVSPARDGMGLDRLAWIDSNWKVISQTPRAGTCLKKYSSVRATIIKYTD